jgi:HAE1 family hydrophobic/amphiphilic exporter-1
MALVTVWIFIDAPKGFLPNEDTGRILISTEAEQGIAFDRMIELQKQAAERQEIRQSGHSCRVSAGSS